VTLKLLKKPILQVEEIISKQQQQHHFVDIHLELKVFKLLKSLCVMASEGHFVAWEIEGHLFK